MKRKCLRWIIGLVFVLFFIGMVNQINSEAEERQKRYNPKNNKLISVEIVENSTGQTYEGHFWVFGLYNTGKLTKNPSSKKVKLIYYDSFQEHQSFVLEDYNYVGFIEDNIEYVEKADYSYIVHIKKENNKP